ncbi:unnamed protein product, partial [Scytosiphon promiscuus]
GKGTGKPNRFYSRPAIVFWPKSKRHDVQMQARASVKRLLKLLRDELALLDAGAPRRSPSNTRAMVDAIVALARQPDSWIESEEDTDVIFEGLHQCGDPVVACRAVSAIYSALSKPGYALRLPARPALSSLPSYASSTTSSVNDAALLPTTDTPFSSVTTLYSRVFSLLDGLGCWRVMSPQLQGLISLNPSAFAGAVIARAALSAARSSSSPTPQQQQPDGRGAGLERQGSQADSGSAAGTPSTAPDGDGGDGSGKPARTASEHRSGEVTESLPSLSPPPPPRPSLSRALSAGSRGEGLVGSSSFVAGGGASGAG